MEWTLAISNEVEGRITVALRVSSFGGALAVLVEWVELLPACPATVGLPMLVQCGLLCSILTSFSVFFYLLLFFLVIYVRFWICSQISNKS